MAAQAWNYRHKEPNPVKKLEVRIGKETAAYLYGSGSKKGLHGVIAPITAVEVNSDQGTWRKFDGRQPKIPWRERDAGKRGVSPVAVREIACGQGDIRTQRIKHDGSPVVIVELSIFRKMVSEKRSRDSDAGHESVIAAIAHPLSKGAGIRDRCERQNAPGYSQSIYPSHVIIPSRTALVPNRNRRHLEHEYRVTAASSPIKMRSAKELSSSDCPFTN